MRDQPERQRRAKKNYLPRVANGSAIAAFALSEPDAGSDVAALACAATVNGDHVVLNGEKKPGSSTAVSPTFTWCLRAAAKQKVRAEFQPS